MSEKQPEKRDKELIDALQAEAEGIEKRAEPFQNQHLTQDDKDDMYQKIMERLKEMGELEEDEAPEATGTDGPAVAPAPPRKPVKRPLWKQLAKCACILLVAGSVVFATSLISEGNRMYWMEKWQNLFPGSKAAIANNNDDRVTSNLSEQEARINIEKELDIPMPELLYLPKNTEYTGYSIAADGQSARVDYLYNDKVIYLSVINNEEDATESMAPKVPEENIINIDTNSGAISIYLIEDKTGGEGTVIYRGQWSYFNCRYELSSTIEKSEILKILKKMRYNV